MKKIIINIDEEAGLVDLDTNDLTGMSDQDVCAILLASYMGGVKQIIDNHTCSDSDCCVKKFNQEIMDAVDETTKLHSLKHRHG